MPKLVYYVYLVCCADGSLYCGITMDVPRRVLQHNRGTGAKYTRSRRPVHAVAVSPLMTHGDALRLERAVKRLPKEQKVAAVDRGRIP